MRSAQISLYNPLHRMFSEAARQAEGVIAAWTLDDLLEMTESYVTEVLIKPATFEMPTLERDRAWLEQAAEVTMTIGQPGRKVTVTRYTLVVPFTGQPPMFRIPNIRSALGGILGQIDTQASTLRLYCDNPRSADKARAYFKCSPQRA